MKKFFIAIGICALLAPLAACLHGKEELTTNAFWNADDQKEMLAFRKGMKRFKPQESDGLQDKLIFESPEKLAEESIAKGDYRLLSVAMGYKASEKDAIDPFLIQCSQSVPVQPLVFGCVPPPLFMFKTFARYNDRILAEPTFPHKSLCAPDLKGKKEFAEWEKEYGRYPY
ncbi:MAG: hypothetical protein ACK4PK_02720 [Alphaproteobacteria bacterium]